MKVGNSNAIRRKSSSAKVNLYYCVHSITVDVTNKNQKQRGIFPVQTDANLLTLLS